MKSAASNFYEINVLEIFLDSQNPRHDTISDQDKIIAHLVSTEKVKELAKDIAKNGLSPLEILGVITDTAGNFIAVEGNRRLCALTLLNDPQAAPEAHRRYFKTLAESSERIPQKILCLYFESRETSDIWVVRRHDGEQAGVGVRKWNSKQKTRHNNRREKKDLNALSLAVIDYAVQRELITKEDSEKKILTTVTRFLGNPFFRKTMGIVSSRTDSEIVINIGYQEFDTAICRFLTDILDDNNTDISSRADKADWEDYAHQLINEGVASTCKGENKKLNDRETATRPNPTPADSDSGETPDKTQRPTEETAEAQPNTGTRTGQTNHPSSRRFIVPASYNPPVRIANLRRIFQEMRNIPIADNTLAVSLITRAFLESTYKYFYENSTGNNPPAQTHIVMQKIISIIEKDKNLTRLQKNALAALKRVQANENNVLSPKTLGAFAHASHYPNAKELTAEWDNISPVIEYILSKL